MYSAPSVPLGYCDQGKRSGSEPFVLFPSSSSNSVRARIQALWANRAAVAVRCSTALGPGPIVAIRQPLPLEFLPRHRLKLRMVRPHMRHVPIVIRNADDAAHD